MRYHVTLDPAFLSEPIVIDVQESPGRALLVRVDGRKVDVDAVAVGPQLSVLVAGRVIDLTTDGSPPDLFATASGRRALVRVKNETQRVAEAATKNPRGASEKVALSPMPGRVVKVLVEKGDSVLVGQPLVVMEAMKMENEIRAKTPGTVLQIHVVPGVAVDANVKLVTLA